MLAYAAISNKVKCTKALYKIIYKEGFLNSYKGLALFIREENYVNKVM